jgi:Tfp pilus assembly protein PilF
MVAAKYHKSFILILAIAVFTTAASVAGAQSALAMVSPESIVKLVNPRSEIERSIVLATPESLAKAREAVFNSRLVPEEEKPGLSEIIRGVSEILYGPVGQFSLESKTPQIAKRESVAIAQIIEASRGKIFPAPQGTEPSFISEILPALAIFRTEDREVSRVANEYADRFESSGIAPSVIPDLVRAKTAKSAGNLPLAYSIYARVAQKYPDVWIARLELGCIALRQNKFVEAQHYLESIYPLRNQDAAFLAAYSTVLYQNARFAEAEPVVRKALSFDASNPELSAIIAHILIDRNAFQEAQPFLEILGRKRPNDRSYLYLKTAQLRGMGRKEEALRWARRAFQQHPRDPEFMVMLSGLLFAGPKEGHREAILLAEEAKRLISEKNMAPSPLAAALLAEAESEASRYLVLDAYNRQDWFAAATLLDNQEKETMDKAMVATILRKSGRLGEALSFSSDWFSQSPDSEAAAEAYLRTLAAASSGASLASMGPAGVSDAGGLGIFSLLMAGTAPSAASSQASLLGLILKILSGANLANYSSNLRSYILYLNGTVQSDRAAKIENYQKALFEEADNLEAILGLAMLYKNSGDISKSLFYLKQARMIGTDDKDLLNAISNLEKALGAE